MGQTVDLAGTPGPVSNGWQQDLYSDDTARTQDLLRRTDALLVNLRCPTFLNPACSLLDKASMRI